jgi:Flp pilus assembly protein TadG
MLRRLRASRLLGQRAQSAVEFALVAPLLIIFVAVGADLARSFFISVASTNSAREGALYASQHAGDVGQTQGALETQITSIMGGEEQGGANPLNCQGKAISFAYTSSNGSSPNVPPPAGTSTTVAITVTCTVTPFVTFKPLPTQYTLKTQVQGLAVGPPS